VQRRYCSTLLHVCAACDVVRVEAWKDG
jgi:hypothetical protein